MRRSSLAVLLVLSGLMTGCVTNPSTGRSQLLLLPSNQVAAMGAEATPQLIQEFGGESASPALRAYVAQVGRTLVQHVEPEFAGIEWQFYVLESEVINAFALPGGKVFMTRGLLQRFGNEAQVAAVLGHEIGHVTGRHVDERLSTTMVAQIGLEILGSATELELVNLGANLLAQGSLLKFGRDQESESDTQGLKYMTAAGYDPLGMVQVLQVLSEAAKGPRQPEMLSTHPHPENRLRTVQQRLKTDYAYTQGNPSFSLRADRFKSEAAPHLF